MESLSLFHKGLSLQRRFRDSPEQYNSTVGDNCYAFVQARTEIPF